MKKTFAAMLLLMTTSTPSLADMADDLRACSGLSDDKSRLACFDLNAKTLAPNPPTPVATPGVFHKIAPADLATETHKWDGVNVETSLNCFFADQAQFRCFDAQSYARLRVDFSEFNPVGEAYLRTHCDTTAAAGSRACLVKIHFVYDGYSRQDMGGFTGHMTLVEPKDGRGEIVK